MWQYDTINGKFIPGTLPAEGNITACYDRLSQEDELEAMEAKLQAAAKALLR